MKQYKLNFLLLVVQQLNIFPIKILCHQNSPLLYRQMKHLDEFLKSNIGILTSFYLECHHNLRRRHILFFYLSFQYQNLLLVKVPRFLYGKLLFFYPSFLIWLILLMTLHLSNHHLQLSIQSKDMFERKLH